MRLVVPPRRRFRWSLRTMFVVVTVLGSVLGWVSWNLHWIRQRREFFGGEYGAAVPAPGLLWLFGEQGDCAFVINFFTEPRENRDRLKPSEVADLERACELFPESQIFWSLRDGGDSGEILIPEMLYYNGLTGPRTGAGLRRSQRRIEWKPRGNHRVTSSPSSFNVKALAAGCLPAWSGTMAGVIEPAFASPDWRPAILDMAAVAN